MESHQNAEPKKYTSNEELFAAYEGVANEAAKIMICNFSALNMATEMGTAQD